MKYSEFDAKNHSWAEKAQSEIKDKSFEKMLHRLIGEHINIASYAESYIASVEEISIIQQAQKRELGWEFVSIEKMQNSSVNELVISVDIQSDIIEEISMLTYKTQQLLATTNNTQLGVNSKPPKVKVILTSDYLLTISKIRAIRFLISRLLAVYNEGTMFTIEGITDETAYKTDNEHINIVRATTMAMSGIIGGCDALYIVPFDKTNNEFSSRIARNTSLILAEESYLEEINDPAAGSYFIENLTYELVKKSWKSFVTKTQ